MAGALASSVRVRDAYDLARWTLRELPDRWRHTAGVASRAVELAGAVAVDDRPVLVAAAWLHDIGYAQPLRDTGFHPLDGARWLDRQGWPLRITALVAHHSAARYVARAHGLAAELDRYRHEESPVSDALAYADQTTGPVGQPMRIEDRLVEMLRRHGTGSVQAQVFAERTPYLLAVADRVRRRLERPVTVPNGSGRYLTPRW